MAARLRLRSVAAVRGILPRRVGHAQKHRAKPSTLSIMGNASSSSSVSSRGGGGVAKATTGEGKETKGHEVGASNVYSDENHEAEVESFRKHQSGAKRLPFPQESRTLVDIGKYGVLSTIAARGASQGFPSGSVVGYAAKKDSGLPIFVFSTLSSHTSDIDSDPRFSLTVTAPGFRGASDGRVSITGKAYKVTDKERVAELKTEYKSKHPNAFWVDFGDFSVYEAQELVQVRLVGGFARAGTITPGDFVSAEVDEVFKFSEPVCGHMNDDHAEQIPMYVKFYTGMSVESAKMLSIDHLGMNVEALRDGQTFKVRLPYPEVAKDRKGVKDQIVAMSRASAGAAPGKTDN